MVRIRSQSKPTVGAVARAAAESMGFEGGRGGVEAGGGSCLEKARDRHCESDSALQRWSDAAGGTVFGLGGAGWAAGLLNLRKAAGRVKVPCSLTMPDLSSGGRRKRIGVLLVSVKWRLTSLLRRCN